MLTSVPVQPGLKSSELVPIGEAAVRFGLRTSALRYYEDRGLVTASARRGGKRWYDREQLRRIAFVQIGRQLGMTLGDLGGILDGPEHRWRAIVEEQIAALDARIERARQARAALAHALECPTARPTEQCRHFVAELDALADGLPGRWWWSGPGAAGGDERAHPGDEVDHEDHEHQRAFDHRGRALGGPGEHLAEPGHVHERAQRAE
jgi:DNA-binding transcriptional MerR regulator